ncbi:hypothetical protein J6590_091820 [Homalodisca vitripennis]|nr:hypothetical protein J6590_091820 [Homalodisca vitripennis]
MERFQVKLNSKVINRHITVLKAQPQPNQTNEAVLYVLKPINVTNKYYLTLRRTRLCTFPPLFFRSINTLPAQFQSSCEAS